MPRVGALWLGRRVEALRQVDGWPVGSVAVAVVRADGSVVGEHGPVEAPFPLASVSKLLTAATVLLAAEEGAFGLDDPAGPPGSTVRHLLSHASGCHPDEKEGVMPPGRKRAYSNGGYEWLGDVLSEATGIPFPEYAAQGLFTPLGMTTARFEGSPAHSGVASVSDLVRFAAELLSPRLLHASTVAEMSTVQFPGLDGLLPGYGLQRPNDWGLGPDIKSTKSPHWTGASNSPETWGHFGRSGTFLWVDPVARAACVCLTDRDFGDWSREAWPPLNDAIVAELAGG